MIQTKMTLADENWQKTSLLATTARAVPFDRSLQKETGVPFAIHISPFARYSNKSADALPAIPLETSSQCPPRQTEPCYSDPIDKQAFDKHHMNDSSAYSLYSIKEQVDKTQDEGKARPEQCSYCQALFNRHCSVHEAAETWTCSFCRHMNNCCGLHLTSDSNKAVTRSSSTHSGSKLPQLEDDIGFSVLQQNGVKVVHKSSTGPGDLRSSMSSETKNMKQDTNDENETLKPLQAAAEVRREPFTSLSSSSLRSGFGSLWQPGSQGSVSVSMEGSQISLLGTATTEVLVITIDGTLPKAQIQWIADSLEKHLATVPQEWMIGLIVFSSVVSIYELGAIETSSEETPARPLLISAHVFRGDTTPSQEDISYLELHERALNHVHRHRRPSNNRNMADNTSQARTTASAGISKPFFVQASQAKQRICSVLRSLRGGRMINSDGSERNALPRADEKRCTGAAAAYSLELATALPRSCGKIILFVGGICNYGPGAASSYPQTVPAETSHRVSVPPHSRSGEDLAEADKIQRRQFAYESTRLNAGHETSNVSRGLHPNQHHPGQKEVEFFRQLSLKMSESNMRLDLICGGLQKFAIFALLSLVSHCGGNLFLHASFEDPELMENYSRSIFRTAVSETLQVPSTFSDNSCYPCLDGSQVSIELFLPSHVRAYGVIGHFSLAQDAFGHNIPMLDSPTEALTYSQSWTDYISRFLYHPLSTQSSKEPETSAAPKPDMPYRIKLACGASDVSQGITVLLDWNACQSNYRDIAPSCATDDEGPNGQKQDRCAVVQAVVTYKRWRIAREVTADTEYRTTEKMVCEIVKEWQTIKVPVVYSVKDLLVTIDGRLLTDLVMKICAQCVLNGRASSRKENLKNALAFQDSVVRNLGTLFKRHHIARTETQGNYLTSWGLGTSSVMAPYQLFQSLPLSLQQVVLAMYHSHHSKLLSMSVQSDEREYHCGLLCQQNFRAAQRLLFPRLLKLQSSQISAFLSSFSSLEKAKQGNLPEIESLWIPVSLSTLSLAEDVLLVLDGFSEVIIWCGRLIIGREDFYEVVEAVENWWRQKTTNQVPAPKIRTLCHLEPDSRRFFCRLAPAHKDPAIRGSSSIRSLMIDAAAEDAVLASFFYTDEKSFTEYLYEVWG